MSGSDTAAHGGTGARRVHPAILAVAALIVVSTAVRFAVAQTFTTPWIAPDEMVYGLIGESLWSDGTLSLRGLASPYYSLLTPALVGAPLAFLDLADGIRWAQLLQALAASLVAVPTYGWARRLVSPPWAVAAAAVTLAAPGLHYAGFLMTEPLTLTIVAAALLALARAVEEPTTWRYGVFAAWATAAAAVRLQALVLLPAFLVAVAVDALAARDRERLRPLVWLAGVSALVAFAVALAVYLPAMIAPQFVLPLFGGSEAELLAFGSTAMRAAKPLLLFTGYQMLVSMYFSAIAGFASSRRTTSRRACSETWRPTRENRFETCSRSSSVTSTLRPLTSIRTADLLRVACSPILRLRLRREGSGVA